MNNLNKVASTSQPTYHPEEEKRGNKILNFEKMLLETFKVKEIKDLPFKKIEYAFDIFNTAIDFKFNDKEERLSNFLVLMASLYSSKKKTKVCFISPTWYYAVQAAKMRNAYLKGLGASNESRFPTVVPGMFDYDDAVKSSSIVFMHGKDYSEYLPNGWNGRKIIQIFPDEKVPVDPLKPSCGYFFGSD